MSEVNRYSLSMRNADPVGRRDNEIQGYFAHKKQRPP